MRKSVYDMMIETVLLNTFYLKFGFSFICSSKTSQDFFFTKKKRVVGFGPKVYIPRAMCKYLTKKLSIIRDSCNPLTDQIYS